MGSTIIAVTVAAITIIMVVAVGLLKSRPKSEELKKSDGDEFARLERAREKEGKNKKQNNDRDISVFNRFQKLIDSNWIQNFEYNQLTYPQYIQVAIMDDLHAYLNESQKSENEFLNQNLAEAHLVFLKAAKTFISTAFRVTTFVRPESKTYVINSKAEGYRKGSKDYDERHDREVKMITHNAKVIINTYQRYVQVAGNESVYLIDN